MIIVYIIIILAILGYFFSFQRPQIDKENELYNEYFYFLNQHFQIFSFLSDTEKQDLIIKIYNQKMGFYEYLKKDYSNLFIILNDFVKAYIENNYFEKDYFHNSETKQSDLEISLIEEFKEIGWHALVKKYHPDMGGDEEIMKLILRLRSNGCFN